MTTFSALGVKRIERRFTGMKINNLDCDVVGKPIRILDYEICPSKKRKDSTYLKMQILLEGKKRFLSTGGKFLQRVLCQIDRDTLKHEPIDTMILKEKGYYFFEGTMVNDDEMCDEGENTDKMEE